MATLILALRINEKWNEQTLICLLLFAALSERTDMKSGKKFEHMHNLIWLYLHAWFT